MSLNHWESNVSHTHSANTHCVTKDLISRESRVNGPITILGTLGTVLAKK